MTYHKELIPFHSEILMQLKKPKQTKQIHTWTDGDVASFVFNVLALTIASPVLGYGVVTIAQASAPAVPTSEGASAPITPFTPAAMNFPKNRIIDGNLKVRLVSLLLYCKDITCLYTRELKTYYCIYQRNLN